MNRHLRWPWHRSESETEAAERARQAEADLLRTQRRTVAVERLADEVGRLSSDEFLDRLSRAFRRPL